MQSVKCELCDHSPSGIGDNMVVLLRTNVKGVSGTWVCASRCEGNDGKGCECKKNLS